ncbi:LacI family DNA-binding transcriptional regulator [Flavobacterium aestivum]|uniref:LacI family DNA-binding transcriptional regulator n=1 Tax=Flavobacterium aestivum TaxID=3003257 RepID=UPI002286385A|nr:LacI family DNA-binding transcriptional regulator [Flavobacterium aestivum]
MKKITMKDIASKAEVSVSTVSFVLNNIGEKMGISATVINKVLAVAQELNYRPNMIASSLRTGETRSIGLIIEDISNQFFSDLAKVVEDEARNLNYRVFYCSTGGDDQRADELVSSLLQANVDGFIIAPTEKLEKTIDNLLKMQVPVVLIDRYFPDQLVSSVVMDNYEGAYSATKKMMDSGCRNIAVVNVNSGMIQMKLRESGYQDALKENGIYDESLIVQINFKDSEEDKIKAITELLKNHPQVDGILFLSNYLGLCGLQAFRQLGINIPSDISVISFDDHDSFRLHTPSISVISQPIAAMAKKAIDMLVSQMTTGKHSDIEKVILKGDFVERESV